MQKELRNRDSFPMMEVQESLELMRARFSKENSLRGKVLTYLLENPGKMIRSTLFLKVCDLVGYQGDFRQSLPWIGEYIHMASLLHDDIVDEAELRRHRKTSRKIWGNAPSVLIGDWLYAEASRILGESRSWEIVDLFVESLTAMTNGELLQMERIGKWPLEREIYDEIILGKTGYLLGSICASAGIIGKVSFKQKEALLQFGRLLGTAFQITDDALDYETENKIFGKELGQDFLQGKVTLPLILLEAALSPESKKSFSMHWETKNLSWIMERIHEHQIFSKTISLAESLRKNAQNLLENSFFPSLERDNLINFSKFLIERRF